MSRISTDPFAYFHSLSVTLRHLDSATVKLFDIAAAIRQAPRIFIAGNGGSAAIANHMCCDVTKGCRPYILDTVSLVANPSMLTAIANDIGYDETISYQLDTSLIYSTDVLILISSSGNSPNIVKAAKKAKKLGSKVIGFTGFDGGQLKKLADLNFHVPSDNYGIIEDIHSSAMHAIAQYIASQASKSLTAKKKK
jgi:D-sedoheptulose 7-phosphate isomerase